MNFAVYASSATSVSLCLFTEADLQAGKVTCELPLSPTLNRTGYTWHILLPKLDTSLLYGMTQCPPVGHPNGTGSFTIVITSHIPSSGRGA